ncbi:hypothetical protein [Leuconostoc mesenteroides]|uniref:hypothetical protein n=1 Tax=Leuconostoc mesenteroides TaxID=1245 RepID=UPI00236097D8|nr:hypothetical protein [Leuconostoc mesenteroides]
MAFARENVNFENIKREADVEMLVKNMVQTNNMIAHLKDEQFEMRNEIKMRDETISKLEDDIRKDKRWNMLWQNSLDDSITKTQISVFVVGFINIIFAYLIGN